MGSCVALVRRELGAYFSSAMAYVILTSMLLVTGYIFTNLLDRYQFLAQPARMEDFLQFLIFVLALLSPLITMRLVAEEKSRGTIETLMTAPVTEAQFLFAKFFAAIVFLHYLIFVPVLGYAAIVSFYAPVDPGALFTAYLATLLVCSAVFSIGMFVSALCQNQITAGVITFMVAVVLLMASIGSGSLERGSLLRRVLERIDLLGSARDLLMGVVDTRDLVYYGSVILLFLFLTMRAVQSRRWR